MNFSGWYKYNGSRHLYNCLYFNRKGDVFMNESEKILRLLNQQWDYRHNNNSFASTFIRLYFGKGSDFIYIRNGRPRYRDVLEKLFKRNENKMNFSWGESTIYSLLFSR